MGDASGETLHSQAVDYIRKRYNKPGRVYLGIVSRLDSMTSGIIVMAKTSKAASRLTPQFSGDKSHSKSTIGSAQKTYLAIVEGTPNSESGVLENSVAKDDAARRMRIVSKNHPDARLAKLKYVCLAQTDDSALVAVRLLTGRKHQIRVQFAQLGHVIYADRKYGSTQKLSSIGIALHSARLTITHPTRKEAMTWSAPPPHSWKAFGHLRKVAHDFTDDCGVEKIFW